MSAVLRLQPDGELAMNNDCVALMFGVSVDQIEKSIGPDGLCLNDMTKRSGVRRRKHYEAVVGNTEPDITGLLSYYARMEGVELVYDDGKGNRRVIVEGPA